MLHPLILWLLQTWLFLVVSIIPESMPITKNGKTPYHTNEALVQKNLAQTLSLITEQGKDAFYRGAIAFFNNAPTKVRSHLPLIIRKCKFK